MLNSSELAALRRIESGLALEDPRLAERLATGRLRTPLGQRLGLLVLLLGAVGLLVGMSVLSGALVVASLVLATLGGTTWLWASGMVPRRLPGA
jgi:protein-S-isoprenylcysteine O-methyltransferase Ste14